MSPASGTNRTSAAIADPHAYGVAFPADESGARGTTDVARQIWSEAASTVDASLSRRIPLMRNWRSQYRDAVRELTAATAGSLWEEVSVATAGLGATRRSMVVANGGHEAPVADVIRSLAEGEPFESTTIQGAGIARYSLELPYGDRVLQGNDLLTQVLIGDDLLAQVDRWVERGIAEPGVGEGVRSVLESPERLRLDGHVIALFGAAGEMSPLQPLCDWGADVIAIDRPLPGPQAHIRRIARAGAGTVTIPVDERGRAGADMVTDALHLADWLDDVAGSRRLILGMYGYADSGMHVRLSAAFDLIAARLEANGRDAGIVGLATPTDTYLVPPAVIDRARAAWQDRGWRGAAQLPVRVLSGGKLLAPAYRGGDAVADVLVPQQGPNYALAKRIQRWRATSSAVEGHPVSFNVAPASWTQSVLSNRVLASAYAGADAFGIEVFQPATARTLMAALMADDLLNPPRVEAYPGALFSARAVHGGLWNRAYEPRTGLPLAALLGATRSARTRRT